MIFLLIETIDLHLKSLWSDRDGQRIEKKR